MASVFATLHPLTYLPKVWSYHLSYKAVDISFIFPWKHLIPKCKEPRILLIFFPKRHLEEEEGQLPFSFLYMPNLFFVILTYSRTCYIHDHICFFSHHSKDKNWGKEKSQQLSLYIANNNLPCSRIFMLAFKVVLMNIDIKDLNSLFLPVCLLSKEVQKGKAAAIILKD